MKGKRHMKCDEVKPVCGPCAKGNRPCVYSSLSIIDTNTADARQRQHSVTSVPPSASPVSTTYATSHAAFAPPRLPSHPHRASFQSSAETPASLPRPQSATDDPFHTTSPQSSYSASTVYGTEVAPLRWFGLLAGDASHPSLQIASSEILGDGALANQCELRDNPFSPARGPFGDGLAARTFSEEISLQRLPSLQASAISAAPEKALHDPDDKRQYWQASKPVLLKDHEYDIFRRYVTGVSHWIDLFDPLKHFSALVPHLALYNEGLMKALLALGARHLSLKPPERSEAITDRTAAVQYYYETLQYLQSAMRYTSYKNSPELLATALVVSTYEMLDGAGKGWERHLKGVFWIQRSREINGESGGLEQAVWWAWLRQDVWAAFREHRRCFSFFKPTRSYYTMNVWDMASRVVYILAQSVNYSSEEEKRSGEADLSNRISRANNLLDMLDEWRDNVSVHFQPLPAEEPSNRAFPSLWIYPPALGVSVQMYCMARILLLAHQPSAGGYLEYLERNRTINECIDTIGGIAMKLTDDASRLMSTQCLFAAGLYCHENPEKLNCIAELIEDHQNHTGWPVNTNLAAELKDPQA